MSRAAKQTAVLWVERLTKQGTDSSSGRYFGSGLEHKHSCTGERSALLPYPSSVVLLQTNSEALGPRGRWPDVVRSLPTKFGARQHGRDNILHL